MKYNKYKDAVQWMYGFTLRETKSFIAKSDTSKLDAILECFIDNAKKAAYND